MFNKLILIPIAIVVIGIFYYLQPTSKVQTLEIYTNEDIIYIEGLTVSFESIESTFTFKDAESLNNYISIVTAEQSNLIESTSFDFEAWQSCIQNSDYSDSDCQECDLKYNLILNQ